MGGRFGRIPQEGARAFLGGGQNVFIDPSLIGGGDPPPPQKVVVADNTDFIHRVNIGELAGVLIRPTKTVVVAQNPSPGDQVPLGTQVTLTLTVKDVIPLGVLGTDPAVSAKFTTVGDLQNAIDANPSADTLKQVLGRKLAYQDLTGDDKTVADTFLTQFGDLSDPDKEKAYDDVSFAFNL